MAQKILLNIYYVPKNVLDSNDVLVNKAAMFPNLKKLTI